MSEAAIEQEVQPSFLDMSDDELANFDPSTLTALPEEPETAQSPEAEPDGDAGAAEVPDGEGEGAAAPQGEEFNSAPVDAPAVEPPAKAAEPAAEGLDYRAEYERLTAPFKANGRDIQIKNVDDAIALMQMGANYNKKMAALKPNLKLMKLLENNGLLSEEKLSFLIDLDKKNPEAINKLVKDSGLDPMDLDADKAGAYKPQTYAVDDREIELDTVLDEIQSTPSYTRTLDIVSNKWDGASKQVVAQSPQLLKVINGHIDSGIYDLISKEIDSERVFGRLQGLSDIEAYRQVGDAIQARGGFDHLVRGRSPQGHQATAPKTVVPPNPKQAEDDRLKDKRRAASSTKPAAPATTPKGFNPLALSDEEFSKVGISKFL